MIRSVATFHFCVSSTNVCVERLDGGKGWAEGFTFEFEAIEWIIMKPATIAASPNSEGFHIVPQKLS
jgi:hypothetical protein